MAEIVMTPEQWGRPTRPGQKMDPRDLRMYEGRRFQTPDEDTYLILDGKARYIDPAVYNAIFVDNDWKEHFSWEEFGSLPKGASITAARALIQTSRGDIYLIDDGKKRHVADGPTMDHYGFDWDKCLKNHDNQYPDGEQIEY